MTAAPTTQPVPVRHRDGIARIGRLAEIGQVLVPGVYAWAVTVLPAATARTHPTRSVAAALVAFVALIVGASLAKTRPRWGFALGIWGFVLLSLLTWLISMPSLQVERLDPWRAGAGTMGWVLFALGWGTPWHIGRHPEDDPRAHVHPKLEPRTPPRLRTALAVAMGAFGAFACLLLAWRATQPDHALLLHGAALACAVAIVNTAASVGLAQGKKRTHVLPRQRIMYAFPWIMAAVALLFVGIAWILGS